MQAVILDCDGVLLESAQIKTEAFAALFRDICPDRLEEVVACHLAHEGVSRYVKFRMVYAEILKQPLSHEQEQALGRRFAALVREALLRAPLVPGAREFLESASRSRAYRLFVASGTPEEELREIARARQLADWVEEWHGSPRSKSQIIRDILRRHGAQAADAVLVGEAVSDLDAARDTGDTVIGQAAIANGRFAACPYRIADLRELPGVLRRVQQRAEGGAS